MSTKYSTFFSWIHRSHFPFPQGDRPHQTIAAFCRRLLLSWLLAVTIEYLLLPADLRGLDDLHSLTLMSLPHVMGSACIHYLLCTVLAFFFPTNLWERWGITVVFGVLSVTAVVASPTWPFLFLCLVILWRLVFYSLQGWNASCNSDSYHSVPCHLPQKDHPQTDSVSLRIVVLLSIGFFLFVSVWTVGRVYSFRSPTYDFGIFSQMFYYLKEFGTPMTTLERDGLLSHFAVHVSPIFYLLLPFYALVPKPATLQILQAAVLTSSVIPLWKLGKYHGLSAPNRILLTGLLLLYPAYAGGTSYDIHENCFLTPLILWLFYGLESRRSLLTVTSSILTLMVKEDAAVYVAVIGLWRLLNTILHLPHVQKHPHAPAEKQSGKSTRQRLNTTWDLSFGFLLLTISLLWFFCVTRCLAQSGDGVMTYRYKNFLYDGSASLFTVVKVAFLQPMKVLYECVDPEKLSFIGLTLLPLLGLPLLTRRFERYFLLIPYLLVNLMSDYTYQHNIFFQYTFGSTAFLMYLTLVNLADIPKRKQQTIVLAAALLTSLVCFCFSVVPKAIIAPVDAIRHYDKHQEIRDTLEQIPEDAPVSTTTFFTTALSQREILYDVKYCSQEHLLSSEYVVLDPSDKNTYKKYTSAAQSNGFQNLTKLLEDHGYVLDQTIEQILVIYHRDP